MFAIGLVVSATVMLAQAEKNPALPPGARLETLWNEGEFTEGGALAADGAILFSDIGNRTLRFDPKDGKVSVFREPSGRANGLIFDPKGRLLAAEGDRGDGGRRVAITELDGTVRTLADSYQGARFLGPNDLAVDKDGNVYVSDRPPGNADAAAVGAVYRIAPDGAVTKVETTANRPNGLAVSPDGKTLYVAESGPTRRVLLAVPLQGSGKPKVLKDFGNGRGIDGMTVTADGKIVAAAGAGVLSGIYIYEPDGVPYAFIATPATPTNCEFGGPSRSTLYITAGKGLHRIETTLTGHHLWPKTP